MRRPFHTIDPDMAVRTLGEEALSLYGENIPTSFPPPSRLDGIGVTCSQRYNHELAEPDMPPLLRNRPSTFVYTPPYGTRKTSSTQTDHLSQDNQP